MHNDESKRSTRRAATDHNNKRWRRQASLAAIQSPNGRRVLGLATLSLVVRLIPAYLVYGSFDVGGWELVQRYAAMGQNPYLTGKLNWPPFWLVMLLYAQKLQSIYNLPSHFAVKIVPCMADSAIAIALFVWFARESGNSAAAYRRALWYALNPVAVATCALQGQFESLPSLFTLLAILSAQIRTETFPRIAVIWLGLAGLAKTWPLLLAPAFLRTMRSRTQRVAFCLLAAAPAVLTVALLYLQDPATIRKNVIDYHGRSGAWGLTAPNSWLPGVFHSDGPMCCSGILYAAWVIVYARTWRRGSPGQISVPGRVDVLRVLAGFWPSIYRLGSRYWVRDGLAESQVIHSVSFSHPCANVCLLSV